MHSRNSRLTHTGHVPTTRQAPSHIRATPSIPALAGPHSDDHLCVLLPGVPLEFSRALGYLQYHRRTQVQLRNTPSWFMLVLVVNPDCLVVPPARAEAVLRASRTHAELCGNKCGNHDLRLKSLFHFPLLEGEGSARTAVSSHHQTLSSRPIGMTHLRMGGRGCGQHDLVLPEPLPGGAAGPHHTPVHGRNR